MSATQTNACGREWRGSAEERGYRSCTYCGSMHPDDLLGFIERGQATGAEMADWKYGFPHKFYVDVPDPRPDRTVYMAKFYLRHLGDLTDDRFEALANWVLMATGVLFERRDDGLYWRAAPEVVAKGQRF